MSKDTESTKQQASRFLISCFLDVTYAVDWTCVEAIMVQKDQRAITLLMASGRDITMRYPEEESLAKAFWSCQILWAQAKGLSGQEVLEAYRAKEEGFHDYLKLPKGVD